MKLSRTMRDAQDLGTPDPSTMAPTPMPVGLLVAVLGAALIVASLSFLVAVRAAQMQSGYRMYAASRQKAELLEERSHLQVEVASLRRPARLARVAAELGLEPVRPDQVVRALSPSAAPAQTAGDEGVSP